MNQTFLLPLAVGLIAGLGGLALAWGLLGLLLPRQRARAGQLLIVAAPAGLLGVLGLYGVASLTGTAPEISAAGIAFLCGAGVAGIAWGTLRWIMSNEQPRS
ncbi:MAG: hypothetical protein F9K47_19800 [Burkholderiales bacterium]|nr:MAG: hypothetical protein F9K47_19800 [Burkholderiales bacterium]